MNTLELIEKMLIENANELKKIEIAYHQLIAQKNTLEHLKKESNKDINEQSN